MRPCDPARPSARPGGYETLATALDECISTRLYSRDQMGGQETVSLPGLVVSGQTAIFPWIWLRLEPPANIKVSGSFRRRTAPRSDRSYGDRKPVGQIRVAGQALPTRQHRPLRLFPRPPLRRDGGATLTAFVGTATANAALTAESPTPEVRATPIVVVDFATFACSAEWQANDGTLECPGRMAIREASSY